MSRPVYRLPPFKVDKVMLATAETIDWGLKLFGIPPLWKETQGEGIKVGVLDTGIALEHPDLQPAILEPATLPAVLPQPTTPKGTAPTSPGSSPPVAMPTALSGLHLSQKLSQLRFSTMKELAPPKTSLPASSGQLKREPTSYR